jgi:predicted transcriptional regulator
MYKYHTSWYRNILKLSESLDTMELKKYLESRNIEIQEFAEMVGVTPCAISNYIGKRREPRPYIRRRIIEVTKGNVTLEDLLKK